MIIRNRPPVRALFVGAAMLAGLSAIAAKEPRKKRARTPASEHAAPQPSADPAPVTDKCKLIEPALEHEDGLGKMSPDFFISVNEDDVFIIDDDTNHMKKLGQPKVTQVPGIYDAVPTVDGGRFLTTPRPMAENEKNKLKFYDMKDVQKAYAEGRNLETDLPPVLAAEISGVYQSNGVRPATADHDPVYRFITDDSGGSMIHVGVSRATGKLEQISAKVPLCPDLVPKNKQLPMLSKDGQYVAAYHAADGSTKIYEVINDQGECREVVDIGRFVGKVDFDYGTNRITYHNDSRSGYFSGVGEGEILDVYTADLVKDANGKVTGIDGNSARRLSGATEQGTGTYYPRWTRSGKVMAVRQSEAGFSIVKFDPNRAQAFPYWSATVNQRDNPKLAARYVLGNLFRKECTKSNLNLTAAEASYYALALDPKACRELVTKYWAQRREEIHQEIDQEGRLDGDVLRALKMEDLQAACPEERPATPAPVRTGDFSGASITARDVMQGMCAECHRDGAYVSPATGKRAPRIDFNDLSPIRAYDSLRMIDLPEDHPAHMPYVGAGQLREAQKNVLRQFLKELVDRRLEE